MRGTTKRIVSVGIAGALCAAMQLPLLAQESDAPYTDLRELRGLPANQVVYVFRSPYVTSVDVKIIVQSPTKMEQGRLYPVLYMLNEYAGNCPNLQEAERLKIFDTYQVICVNVGYPGMPWYANHPDNPRLQQERFFLEAAIPLVDSKLPTRADGSGRFLLGYSKGGFGAFTLLLRHPDLFAKAAAWDAPLSLEKPDHWDMASVYGTQDNYDRYAPLRLLREKADVFRSGPERFVLLGYSLFPDEVRKTHELMTELRIPHAYDSSTKREHNWSSGWFSNAVERLLKTQP